MKSPLITSDDVINLYQSLEAAGITFWIDGGWAIDALLEYQTRPHEDLDIAIEQKDAIKMVEFLENRGYKKIEESSKWNFVLGDEHGRRIDFHVFVRNRTILLLLSSLT